jgi:hypothetical protein
VAARTVSRPLSVKVLLFLLVFLGINGLIGGIPFLLAPDGHLLQLPFSHLKNTPFPDFTIPGLLLTLFLGLYPLAGAYALWRKPAWRWPEFLNPFRRFHWSWVGSLAAGVIAVIWIIVQIQWIPIGFLHIFILTWGVLILIVALLPGVRRYCLRSQ